MSLRGVHLVFIICAIMLSFFTAYWSSQHDQWALAIITGTLGFTLLGYGLWFLQKLLQGRT